MIGPHCPIDLPTRDAPYCVRIGERGFDDRGHETGERINGFDQCPKCLLWWPCLEEPDCWEESDDQPGKWIATGWWGAAVCEECELLMVEQPDGTPECYQLGEST